MYRFYNSVVKTWAHMSVPMGTYGIAILGNILVDKYLETYWLLMAKRVTQFTHLKISIGGGNNEQLFNNNIIFFKENFFYSLYVSYKNSRQKGATFINLYKLFIHYLRISSI